MLGLCCFYAYVALSAIYYDSVEESHASSYEDTSVSYFTSRYVKTIWGFAFLVSVNPLIGKNGYTVESEMIRYVFKINGKVLHIHSRIHFLYICTFFCTHLFQFDYYFYSCAPNWAATDELSLFYNCSTMTLGFFVPTLLILTANGLALRVCRSNKLLLAKLNYKIYLQSHI